MAERSRPATPVTTALAAPPAAKIALDGLSGGGSYPHARPSLRTKKRVFVVQTFNLLSRTTARQNVALPLVYAKIGRAERRQMAE